MTTPNEEDERAADAFLVSMTETVHGTASGLLKRGFTHGYATAREKYQKQLAEERAHADRLWAFARKHHEVLTAKGTIGGPSLDLYWEGVRVMEDHRKRREGEG